MTFRAATGAWTRKPGRRGGGGSGGAAVPTNRQVTSRSYISNIINATLPTSMSRTTHFTQAAVTALTISWDNGFVNNNTGIYTASGGTMSITASVEYPAGTFTQVKFTGVATGTAASGLLLTADSCTVTIPTNTQFWIRTWYSNPTVGAMYQADLGNIGINGEAFHYGGTVTDTTMSGSVPNDGSAAAFAPVSVVGLSTKNAYLCVGDSMLAGTGDLYSAQSAEVGILGRSLWGNRAYAIFGCPGMTAASFPAGATVQQAVGGNFTAVVSEYGSNDLVFPYTAVQVIANQNAIKALYPGKAFYVTTIPPRTTSTDSWATTANQTPLASEAQRIAYNTAVRAGGLGFSGYIELADQCESARNSGFWKVNGGANFGTADGIHPSQTMYASIAASGVVTSALPA